MIHFWQLTFVLFASHLLLVDAGNKTYGVECDLGQNRLLQGNYQFYSDCITTGFCNSDVTPNVCERKKCRREDFPFGFTEPASFPDKCPRGQFCPDEMSGCQPWIPLGQPCQLNRDDQCEAPPNFRELRDTTARGLNFNGSVCLNNVCMWANKTVDEACTVENTAYIGYENDGEEFIDIVSRGDCRVGLYCDAPTLKCMQNKNLGDACTADKECDSWNCLGSGFCGENSAIPKKISLGVYIAVGAAILLGIVGTLVGLYFIHRKHRDLEREKRVQYWREQNAFHQNLLQMRETARASLHSLHGGSGDGGNYSDESHTPILANAAPKGSGLRYATDESDDESIMQHQQQRVEGRF